MDDLQPERPDVKPERSEWGGEGMDIWIDKQMDGEKSCVLQDFVPIRVVGYNL